MFQFNISLPSSRRKGRKKEGGRKRVVGCGVSMVHGIFAREGFVKRLECILLFCVVINIGRPCRDDDTFARVDAGACVPMVHMRRSHCLRGVNREAQTGALLCNH
jgi:hypothetical protein